MEWSEVNSRQRTWSAVVGGTAIVTMGTLAGVGDVGGGSLVSDPTTTSVEQQTTMNTGQTSIDESVAPTSPVTPSASPEVTTTPTSAAPG
jgi:hypothetical protein